MILKIQDHFILKIINLIISDIEICECAKSRYVRCNKSLKFSYKSVDTSLNTRAKSFGQYWNLHAHVWIWRLFNGNLIFKWQQSLNASAGTYNIIFKKNFKSLSMSGKRLGFKNTFRWLKIKKYIYMIFAYKLEEVHNWLHLKKWLF